MKKVVLAVFAVSLFLAAGTSKGFAAQQDFVLVNSTGVEINNLYISPAKEDKWGDDVLGEDVLEDGQSVTIHFPHSGDECIWDFMVKDEEGTGVQWTDIDLCKYATVTLHMDDEKVWATFE